MADEEKKTTISYTFVPVRPFPDWEGLRTTDGPRSKIVSPGFYKPEFSLPVPTEDEDCQAIYNLTLAQLLAKGVRQVHYDRDGDIKDWYKEQAFTEDADLNEFATLPPDTLWFCEVKERKASEARKMKEIQAKHGVTPDDIDALLSDPVALKAKLADLEAQAKAKKASAKNKK